METCFICGESLYQCDEVAYIPSGNSMPAHIECAERDYPEEGDLCD